MDHITALPEDVSEDPDSLGFTLTHPNGLVVDIAIACDDWVPVFTPAFKEKCINIMADTVSHEGYDQITVAVMLTDDDAIADMNTAYRGKEGPTDVLSFPDDDDDFLGDIALAFGVVQKQASEMSIDIADHILHLMVHGVLHLCGYDHIDPDEAEVMEGIEIEILARHGMANPYLAQGGA